MKHSRENTPKVAVNNLKTLMAEFGIDPPELAKKSGVSPRMVNYILAEERKPSLEVIDKLASVFGIHGWMMLLPDIHANLIKNGRLERLLNTYLATSDDSRDYIDRVAEREATYKQAS